MMEDAKPKPPRLLVWSVRVVQAFRIANAIAIAFFVAVLIATLPGAELIERLLVRKYHGRVDTAAVIAFLQLTMLVGIPVGVAVERLLKALRAILRTVEQDDPFARTNAARVRTIGWMLLVIQLADLGYGLARVAANVLHIDYPDWQPSFTGWLAVLIAFVLAQVFERGAAMRDDLDGTV
ncbi:hypothetical protein AVM11_05750 [Sphingomonas melonis TY]|jgi:hypothetical protein|uniref:Uncharacterized protein n=1 Tax=Sphingomonas melonis TY TaxID=621456 RepID=A0A175Y2Q1_9SPHN|nr:MULTISPECIES: DUF2975 domain-containing protein [Sphingomonas]AOW25024.1 hypothetical protein BJP26_16955 [Sphingomonas melonis TY]ATI57099.1 DUF2975 domain-containing protein [Sphingomonas melonis]KZB94947.1 hypothetical protein AVM11_05750 [Sphingomonas melonis TY]MBI0531915.1 DUF2975 domain-containing protein [Sphingomonas sp. TX0522]MBX8846089.1 DUF2975 domain-containing protein [Sphingomonas melonis]